ncbi:MAG: DUF4234 domain-containing protein [Lachnospiraceae bacterium]|nr:DUF4234 domain-containing protein [Lachnospiraceae bacterium]
MDTRGTNRNIAVCIILSMVTCGIYMFYWLYKLNEEINALADEPDATNGALVIIFTIITCNIYMWFWLYKMGERVDRIKANQGKPAGSNSSVIYLILAICGLDIVDLALMQDTVNNAVA